MVLRLNKIEQLLQTSRNSNNNGDFIRVAATSVSTMTDEPSYLITYWQNFDNFQMFAFCNFIQRLKNNQCIELNEDEVFPRYHSENLKGHTYTCTQLDTICQSDDKSLDCKKM